MRDYLFSATAERMTNGIAVGAVASPVWLHHVSETASALLPILGVLWLVIQMVGYIRKGKK